jgi:hypothetical protein
VDPQDLMTSLPPDSAVSDSAEVQRRVLATQISHPVKVLAHGRPEPCKMQLVNKSMRLL